MKVINILLIVGLVLISGCSNGDKKLNDLEYAKSGAEVVLITGTYVDNKTKAQIINTVEGGGIYIGNGFILTASHILEKYKEGMQINVLSDNEMGQAFIKNKVDAFKPGNGDIAVLQLSTAMRETRKEGFSLPLCLNIPEEKDDILVAKYHSVYKVVSFSRDFSENPPYVGGSFQPGTSGAGIIDVNHQCLAGIVSFSNSTVSGKENILPNQSVGTQAGQIFYTPSSNIRYFLDEWKVPYSLSK